MTLFIRPPLVFGNTAVQKNQQVGYGDSLQSPNSLASLPSVVPPKVKVDLESFFVRQNHFLMAPSNKLLPLYSAGSGAVRVRRQAISRSARKQRILKFLQEGPKPQNMLESYHKLVTTILSSENNYFGWYNLFLPDRIPGPSFYYEMGILKDGSGGSVFGPEGEAIILYPNGTFRAFVDQRNL